MLKSMCEHMDPKPKETSSSCDKKHPLIDHEVNMTGLASRKQIAP